MISIKPLRNAVGVVGVLCAVSALSPAGIAQARPQRSEAVTAILKKISGLRALPDDTRGEATRTIALAIRDLKEPGIKVGLASGLANLATEGDYGHATLQAVADTLSQSLAAEPPAGDSAGAFLTLAQLVRYEHVSANLKDPKFVAALKQLVAEDAERDRADFALKDLEGHDWTLKALKGKVVVVNFWATWCPPCRKELPDLQELSVKFKDKGLVVLGITDEEISKVQPFVSKQGMTYPILLDAGRKVNKQFNVLGIPRTVIYDRNGHLAAEAIDMRTRPQLLALLAKAGIK